MKISSMTRIALILTTSLGLSSVAAALDDQASDSTRESKIRESVVKISATMRYPDLTHPWTKHSPQEASGTGVVIDGKRILTNAHVVLYASQLFVESYQSSDKLPAKVEAVSPGIDLAVLKLEDESFFDKRPPLCTRATLPEVKDTRARLWLSSGRLDAVDHQGDRVADRVAGYNEGVGRARADRRRDQPGQ